MSSGDSGTTSNYSDILFNVGSIVGGVIGSLAGQAVSEQGAELGGSVGGAVAGTVKEINSIMQGAFNDIVLEEQVLFASNYL